MSHAAGNGSLEAASIAALGAAGGSDPFPDSCDLGKHLTDPRSSPLVHRFRGFGRAGSLEIAAGDPETADFGGLSRHFGRSPLHLRGTMARSSPSVPLWFPSRLDGPVLRASVRLGRRGEPCPRNPDVRFEFPAKFAGSSPQVPRRARILHAKVARSACRTGPVEPPCPSP